jgi:hypothetical protein
MNLLEDREASQFRPASRLSQGIAGIILLAFTVFADIYAIRDFVWFFERVRLNYIEPAFSGGVLAISPWLLLVSYRLITGGYEHRDLFSPIALIVLGAGLCAVGVLGWRSEFFDTRSAYGVVATGIGAVSLGWYRARRSDP